jgi:hypothetical protein
LEGGYRDLMACLFTFAMRVIISHPKDAAFDEHQLLKKLFYPLFICCYHHGFYFDG